MFTLIPSSNPAKPFCVELAQYVTIDVNVGLTANNEVEELPSMFAGDVEFRDISVAVMHVKTPLYEPFTYQPRSGDVDGLLTPFFDSMFYEESQKRACLEMLGQALMYGESHTGSCGLLQTTSRASASESEEDVEMMGLIAAFLWNTAFWLDPIAEYHYHLETMHNNDVILLRCPQGVDLFEHCQGFNLERGSILVKALEAYWALVAGGN